MRFRPCIDLHEGKVKQIVGSTLGDTDKPLTNFSTELPPSHFAKMYRDDDLPGGHVIMLGSGNEVAACEALGAYPGGMHVGGGINPQNAGRYLDAGASHVIVTSYVFKDGKIRWECLDELRKKIGRGKVVLDLSCKKLDGAYFIVTNRWQCFTEVKLSGKIFGQLALYCDEFLVHAADVEGKMGGIDTELVTELATWATLPVTYAGGVRSLDDLESIRAIGNGRIDVTVGSALDIFGGTLSYREVVNAFNRG